jgi:transposase
MLIQDGYHRALVQGVVMANKRPLPANSLEELRLALHGARTIAQFQRAQCLWLRAALGLSAQQVATALGWKLQAVYNHQSRYLQRGAAALAGPGRGGRRHNVLNREQETKLLGRLRIMALPDHTVDFGTIHRAVEQAAGHPVDPSTVRRMLQRHRWTVLALAVSPWSPIPPSAAKDFRSAVAEGRGESFDDYTEIKQARTRNTVRYLPPNEAPPDGAPPPDAPGPTRQPQRA